MSLFDLNNDVKSIFAKHLTKDYNICMRMHVFIRTFDILKYSAITSTLDLNTHQSHTH